MKLTPLQQLHYPTIKYFLSDARAQGKSWLIAYTYLMDAIEHPGRKYKPMDFPNNNYQNQKYLMEIIVSLAKELNLNIKVYMSTMEFTMKNINPFLEVNNG